MKLRLALALLPLLTLAPVTGAEERADLSVVHRIKAEAFQRSKVMQHVFHLADANGPRLAGSPGYRRAAEWAVRALREWGVPEAGLDPWGREVRGWALARFSARLTEPAPAPLVGVVRAWSSGTQGRVTGAVVHAPLFASDAEAADGYHLKRFERRIRDYIERHKGKLRGKIVLIDPPRDFDLPTRPAGERYDEKDLADLSRAPDPAALPEIEWPLDSLPADMEKRWEFVAYLPVEIEVDYYERKMKTLDILHAFLRDEGAAAVFSVDDRGAGGTIFAEEGGSFVPGAPVPPPIVALQPEAYGRLVRLLEKKVPVEAELEVEVRLDDSPQEGVNVVAEIPGGAKRNEVVMLGAHLDSWHGGTGAADNASGCAVALEAVRVLQALGLKMDRTVRLALWDGEEQAYFGSRAYVGKHFADPVRMEPRPAHARFSAYFNIDNGAGKIRGVYLQGNDMVRPIFEAWLRPFADLGAQTLSIQNTCCTDHAPFDDVGLPGFQFIQDPLDYLSRTHHSDLDLVDHVEPADLMQASAILASFVYHAATRPEMLPRKPLPKPLPPKKQR